MKLTRPRKLVHRRYLLPILLAASCLLPHPASANDAAFSGAGGTPVPMRGEHHSIAMQSEKIRIVADLHYYDTTVDFIFRNDGPATSVQMGFPESSYGDEQVEKKSAFLRFNTWVDGRKVPAKRIVVSRGSDEEDKAYWLKTVSFGRHQSHRVRVAYRSPMGGTTMWGTNAALVYDFTGKNWKGEVERSDLEIRVKAPGLWLGVSKWEDGVLPMAFESRPNTAVFRKTWRHWQAQGSFLFGLTPAIPGSMWDRATLSPDIAPPAVFRSARTFRVGPVPKELPDYGVNAPPAFTRGGVTYVSLAHLKRRLSDFADDLEKYRGVKALVDLSWDAKTKSSSLKAGAKTLVFFEGNAKIIKGTMPIQTLSSAPLVLHGQYDATLYVPLAPVARLLGLEFKLMPQERLFELTRGRWDGR